MNTIHVISKSNPITNLPILNEHTVVETEDLIIITIIDAGTL